MWYIVYLECRYHIHYLYRIHRTYIVYIHYTYVHNFYFTPGAGTSFCASACTYSRIKLSICQYVLIKTTRVHLHLSIYFKFHAPHTHTHTFSLFTHLASLPSPRPCSLSLPLHSPPTLALSAGPSSSRKEHAKGSTEL